MSDRVQYDKLSDDICEISKIESDLAKKRSEHNIIPHKINETTKTILSNSVSKMKSVGFICEKCNKTFSTNGNLKYHVDKNSCKIMPRIKCKRCDKIFTTNTSMYRHMRNICKIKKEDANKRKILELQKQLDELQNKNEC